jgi:hypothetical protein
VVAPADDSYRIDVMPAVRAQVAAIHARAMAEGSGSVAKLALKSAINDLANSPLSFGDPVHPTRLPEGTVYHALRTPLSFRYAVFPNRLVLLYDVRWIPGAVFGADA